MSAGKGTLLALEEAVVTSRNGDRTWSLNATASGSRVTLVGDFTPLFGLLTGELELRKGTARIGNVDAARAVATGTVGLMLHEVAFPRTWSLQRYLEESALLGGVDRSAARELVRNRLHRFDLEALGPRLLGTLASVERRLLSLANAALLDPEVLVCDRPLERLDANSAERVGAALDRAARDRSLILSIGAMPPLGPERVQADNSDTLIVLEQGRVSFVGAPSDWQPNFCLLSVTVSGNWEAFGAALQARGLSPTAQGFVDALHVLEQPPENGRYFRFSVEMPEASGTSGVFEASLATAAPILELRPIPFRS